MERRPVDDKVGIAMGAGAAHRSTAGARGPAGGAVMIAPDRRLVVPVVSGCGGVGRTTVAALLAATLHRHTAVASNDNRGCAVLDIAPRGQSPWPAWVSTGAVSGTSALAGFRGSAGGSDADLSQLTDSAASQMHVDAPTPLWVLTDTGRPSATYLGGDPGPRWWLPVLPGLRAAVVDGDSLEGARLSAQAAGGAMSSIAAWFATPFLNTAAVWVTDSGEASLQRTVDALTCIAQVRLPVDRIVVAVTERRGGTRRKSDALPQAWRQLIDGRIGAVVELGHDRTLTEQGGRPGFDAATLDRPEVLELARAVASAARLPWIPEGEAALEPPAPGGTGSLSELLLRQAGRAALR
jgi:hypothetical protein